MKIAYQGEPGAFSEAAALQISAGHDVVEPVPCHAFEDVFDAVKNGAVACGVLPIENSIGGSIHRNFDLLLEHNVPIVGEVELPVIHHLLAFPGTTLERVRRVYSHPQGLAQCDRFLRTLKGVEIIATYDTAGSAKMIVDQKMEDAAAIASARAGEVFGLKAIRSSIQDYEHNTTRFLIISAHAFGTLEGLSSRKPDKTSIVFTLPNEPGALFKALSVFALRGIDLTKLESRPIPDRKWEYLFYVDLAGDEVPCSRALAHLAEFAPTLRILGSYPSYRSNTSGISAARTTSAPGARA